MDSNSYLNLQNGSTCKNGSNNEMLFYNFMVKLKCFTGFEPPVSQSEAKPHLAYTCQVPDLKLPVMVLSANIIYLRYVSYYNLTVIEHDQHLIEQKKKMQPWL